LKRWIIAGLTIAVLLAVIIGIITLRRQRTARLASVMSVHDQVTKVVQIWAHLPDEPDDKDELEVIWAKSGSQFDFYPYAAQNLTIRLNRTFHDSKRSVLMFTDIYASTNTKGKIKTVDELATAVRQNYIPQ
jgi:hypothetical protein